MSVAAEEKAIAPSFADLFNERCIQLGLLNAPEIAQRIVAVQPAMGRVDLARSVRNWQAGRNVPRPDFYRIILQALEVDRDRELSAAWHRVYSEAKAPKPGRAQVDPQHDDGAQPDEEQIASEILVAPRVEARDVANSNAPSRAFEVPEPDAPSYASFERSTASSKAAPVSETDRADTVSASVDTRLLAVVVVMTVLLITVALGTSSYVSAAASGKRCDRLAGASWDPQRNQAIGSSSFGDIADNAIEACEEAVHKHPQEGRYWFQLGRAHDRDAQRHGNYTDAHWAFRRAQRLGYSSAALGLGMLHEDGLVNRGAGSPAQPNLKRAAELYQEAAAANLPMGHYCHAISTLFGWSGERPDPARALISAEAAVASGSNRALALLADLRAKRRTTQHVECSQEPNVARSPQPIAWGDDHSTLAGSLR